MVSAGARASGVGGYRPPSAAAPGPAGPRASSGARDGPALCCGRARRRGGLRGAWAWGPGGGPGRGGRGGRAGSCCRPGASGVCAGVCAGLAAGRAGLGWAGPALAPWLRRRPRGNVARAGSVAGASCGECAADLRAPNNFSSRKSGMLFTGGEVGEMRGELGITARWLCFISVRGGGAGG